MDHVVDALLLLAMNHNRAHVDFDSQSLYASQRSGDDLAPVAAFAGDMYFLRCGQRRKDGHTKQPDELWRTLQNKLPQFPCRPCGTRSRFLLLPGTYVPYCCMPLSGLLLINL